MSYHELEKRVQLHEEVEVYYTVDGYQAEFVTNDGATVLASAHADTIEDALVDLNNKVGPLPERPAEFRKLHGDIGLR